MNITPSSFRFISETQTNPGFEPDEENGMKLRATADTVEIKLNEVDYIMYKRRWIGLLSICAFNISASIVWLTFAAVTAASAKWMNRGETEVNLTAILYFIGYVIMSPFSGYAFEKWGIKRALIFGGILNLVGSWLRYFSSFIESSENSYMGRLTCILIGQFIAAVGQPFFLNAPPKFAAVWFSESSRATATMIGSVSNPLGAAVAMFLIPLICEKPEDMPQTLLIVAVISTIPLIPVAFTPAEPPSPPSASAEIALAEAADEPFWMSIKKTSGNKQFWILFTAFSVFVAFFNAFSSLINQIVVPYEYSDDDAGIFGVCLIIAGLLGAGICGPFIDKTKKHKLVLKILTPLLGISYIAFIFAVRKDAYIGICVVCAALGIWSFALLPVALELGIECTYPVPPSSSVSLLWVGGQALSVIFLVVGDSMRDESKNADPPKNMQNALISMAVVACITALLVFLYNSPNHRMEAEMKKKGDDEAKRNERVQ